MDNCVLWTEYWTKHFSETKNRKPSEHLTFSSIEDIINVDVITPIDKWTETDTNDYLPFVDYYIEYFGIFTTVMDNSEYTEDFSHKYGMFWYTNSKESV